jgi:hypothetical protein
MYLRHQLSLAFLSEYLCILDSIPYELRGVQYFKGSKLLLRYIILYQIDGSAYLV